MWLLRCQTLELVRVDDYKPGHDYAILSHTWSENEDDEVTFADLKSAKTACKPCAVNYEGKAGYAKIDFCVRKAALHKLEYAWIDTCCIDRANTTDLQKAFNHMYRWYAGSKQCYVYLEQFATIPKLLPLFARTPYQILNECRWLKRGWTLLELLAPSDVGVYLSDGTFLGTKSELADLLQQISGIPRALLRGDSQLGDFTLAQRYAWVKGRETKEPEDLVHCLFGILDVSLQTNYGEGRLRSLERLYQYLYEHGKDSSFLLEAEESLKQSVGTMKRGREIREAESFVKEQCDIMWRELGSSLNAQELREMKRRTNFAGSLDIALLS